jgi:hypothetical protein
VTTATRTGCPDCGVVARLHDRETVPRDVDAFGRRARLLGRKRGGAATSAPVPGRTSTERSRPSARAPGRPSGPARRSAGGSAGTPNRSRWSPGTWAAGGTRSCALPDHGEELVDDPNWLGRHRRARSGRDRLLAVTRTRHIPLRIGAGGHLQRRAAGRRGRAHLTRCRPAEVTAAPLAAAHRHRRLGPLSRLRQCDAGPSATSPSSSSTST